MALLILKKGPNKAQNSLLPRFFGILHCEAR
jgi:hypothetical protein